MTEKDIEKEVCNYAKDQGFLVRKYNSTTIVGVPDRIFFGHGLVFLIEFKKPGGVLAAAQIAEINRIKEHGVHCFVVDDVLDGKTIIEGAVAAGISAAQQIATQEMEYHGAAH